MIKKIKSFLLTAVALGFLQLESLAMEDDNNNTATIRQTTVQERRETDDRLHNELTRIRENATGFSKNIEDALSSILNRLQQQSEENVLLTRTVMELQQRINPLIHENAELNRKISELQEQINPSNPLRAVFRHSNYGTNGWAPYTTTGYTPVTFDHFEGNERLRGNLSIIEIPEDGVYSLYAHYCWRTVGGPSGPYTVISINNNLINYYVHHVLTPAQEANDSLNRVTRLKRGDMVMVAIQGFPNSEYCLNGFQFDIEKIY